MTNCSLQKFSPLNKAVTISRRHWKSFQKKCELKKIYIYGKDSKVNFWIRNNFSETSLQGVKTDSEQHAGLFRTCILDMSPRKRFINVIMFFEFKVSSIHPVSSAYSASSPGHSGSRLSELTHPSLSLITSSSSTWGCLRPDERCNPSDVFWVFPIVFSQLEVPASTSSSFTTIWRWWRGRAYTY